MMIFWGIILGLPMMAYGGVLAAKPQYIRLFNERFATSRGVAVALAIIAWALTARELDIIGIDVFDKLLKRFPGELWILAAVLAYLTIIWMPKHLSVRALTAILMLFPASLFRTTRLLVPQSGVALVHIFVIFAYICAVIGMYGMFYPWRLEKGMALTIRRDNIARIFGGAIAFLGTLLFVCGFAV